MKKNVLFLLNYYHLSFIQRQEARQKHLEAHNNPAFQSDEEKAKEVEAIKEV